MAHLAACSTRALCAAKPPLQVRGATLVARRRSLRGQQVAAAAAPSPPPTDDSSGGGGTSRPPSARQLARQQRIAQQAQDARIEASTRAVYGRGTTWQLRMDEQAASRVEALAAKLLGAGMTRAAVVKLLASPQSIAALEPPQLAPKLASARAFIRGERRCRCAQSSAVGAAVLLGSEGSSAT